MSSNHKKYLITVVILLIASLFIVKVGRTKDVLSPGEANLAKFPLTIGEWQGEDCKISEDVYEILGTRDVIIRKYTDPGGASLILAVVYSGHSRGSFHPPEICYLGGGFRLLEKTQDQVVLGKDRFLKINKLVMKNKQDIVEAWYWFIAGDKFISSYYMQQLYLLRDAFQRKDSKGALIRIAINNNSKELEKKARSFIKEVALNIKDFL